jgi:hypothetical protein
MRHDETRDNTTAIENQIREADAHEDVRGACRRLAIHNSRHIRLVEERDDAPAKILPLIVTVDELPPATYPKPYNPPVQIVEQRHPEHNDGANGYDEDEPEDDGQPSEYEEWQDYMGGDEYYDHSENEMW